MSYSNIKRILAAALLIAFTAPSTFAISGLETTETLPEQLPLSYKQYKSSRGWKY